MVHVAIVGVHVRHAGGTCQVHVSYLSLDSSHWLEPRLGSYLVQFHVASPCGLVQLS